MRSGNDKAVGSNLGSDLTKGTAPTVFPLPSTVETTRNEGPSRLEALIPEEGLATGPKKIKTGQTRPPGQARSKRARIHFRWPNTPCRMQANDR